MSDKSKFTNKSVKDEILSDWLFHIVLWSFVVWIMLYCDRFPYWLSFPTAKPSKYLTNHIDLLSEPVQTEYPSELKNSKAFIYKSLIKKDKAKLIPQAHYVIAGRAVAYNYSFLIREGLFDSIALYDLGLVWGELSDKKLFKKNYKIKSQRLIGSGARMLFLTQLNDVLPWEYSWAHFSHTHIIPANKNIMGALLKIKKYDEVVLEGELVDMARPNGYIVSYTSLSRTDSDPTSRGSGACETMYVTKVRIGNKIYE